MKHPILTISTILCLLAPTVTTAEVNFPLTRNAVGPGEFYLLENFGDWFTQCLRDKSSEDICQGTKTITALEHGLALELSITPYGLSTEKSRATVDVVPIAHAVIAPLSASAKHYGNYSAAITEVDGMAFDSYWCSLQDLSSCFRGPELIQDDLRILLEGQQATITIYDKRSTPEDVVPVTEITVNLGGLASSVNRANAFNAEIFGIDLAFSQVSVEMCDLYIDGVQRRISYTYDEDYDAENTTWREFFRGARGGGSCPSYVALAYLTPDMTPAQRNMFCLVYDEERKTTVGFQQGEGDAYRVCKAPSRSFCERVNATKDAAIAITGIASTAVGGTVGATTVSGTTVVMHSSGAAILTGSSGYVAGTLGTLASAVGVLTAPATVTAAAISVVVVGGAVYVCQDEES